MADIVMADIVMADIVMDIDIVIEIEIRTKHLGAQPIHGEPPGRQPTLPLATLK